MSGFGPPGPRMVVLLLVAATQAACTEAGPRRQSTGLEAAFDPAPHGVNLTIQWSGQRAPSLLVIAIDAEYEARQFGDVPFELPGLVLVRGLADSQGSATVEIRTGPLADMYGHDRFKATALVTTALEVLAAEDSPGKGGWRVRGQQRLRPADGTEEFQLVCTPASKAAVVQAFGSIEPLVVEVPPPGLVGCSPQGGRARVTAVWPR